MGGWGFEADGDWTPYEQVKVEYSSAAQVKAQREQNDGNKKRKVSGNGIATPTAQAISTTESAASQATPVPKATLSRQAKEEADSKAKEAEHSKKLQEAERIFKELEEVQRKNKELEESVRKAMGEIEKRD